MSSLTAVQLANVATLAAFIQSIPESEYNHRWINADIRPMEGYTSAICAAGHAAKNRERFLRPSEVPDERYAPEAFNYDTVELEYVAAERRHWAVEAFGHTTWEMVFSTYAFNVDISELSPKATISMVANRLNRIARDGHAEHPAV